MVDKNLFLYDLAIVAIMKGEEHYVKEWIDYHLLAGADHFYIYDNDSTPDFKKILQPYIDSNIVTYIHYPGKSRQYEAYNDAFKKFRLQCRYMAWIDGDEFIFPKSKPAIAEVVDEVFENNPNFGGLTGNLIAFGSNGHEKADYTRGVLERFTARNKNVDHHVSTIANPRKIDFFLNPHYAIYFTGCYAVNENRGVVFGPFNEERTANKIEMHHHHQKSREEYIKKIERGTADGTQSRTIQNFIDWDKNDNEIQEENILKYRDARRDALIGKGGVLKHYLHVNKLIFRDFSTRLHKIWLRRLSEVRREIFTQARLIIF